jgi:hypothetical protein
VANDLVFFNFIIDGQRWKGESVQDPLRGMGGYGNTTSAVMPIAIWQVVAREHILLDTDFFFNEIQNVYYPEYAMKISIEYCQK